MEEKIKDILNTGLREKLMENEYISLICTTQGNRIEDFERLISSLKSQTSYDFELILVVQNNHDSVKTILNGVSFKTHIIETGLLSLSKARNIGLKKARGNIYAFPDDDCWYDSKLIERVREIFKKEPVDVISLNVYDPIKGRNLSAYKRKHETYKVTEWNALKYTISVGIFCRANECYFDEELGAGAKWGAGEESDYIYQLLYRGMNIKYYRDLAVYHPYNDNTSIQDFEKAKRYGQGFGALVRKTCHRGQGQIVILYIETVIRTIGGIVVYSFRKSDLKLYYKARLEGMIDGLVRACQR